MGWDRSLIANATTFPGGLAGFVSLAEEESVDGSMYLDLTRFSVEDVDRAMGTESESFEFSEEMSPALRELLESAGHQVV